MQRSKRRGEKGKGREEKQGEEGKQSREQEVRKLERSGE